MIQEVLDTAEIADKKNIIIGKESYNKYLEELNSFFADKDLNYFNELNSVNRIKELYKYGVDKSIKDIYDYLKILATIEQNGSIEDIKDLTTVAATNYTGDSSIIIKVKVDGLPYEPKYNFYR